MAEISKAKEGLRNGCLIFLLFFGGCFAAIMTDNLFLGVTKYQEEQLRVGMTKDEVVQVLGKPHDSGDMKSDFWIYWTHPRTFDPLKLGFDKDGRLCGWNK